MKQYVKLFVSINDPIDTQINQFLNKHPNYLIDKINFEVNGNVNKVLIVFNVTEEQFRTHE